MLLNVLTTTQTAMIVLLILHMILAMVVDREVTHGIFEIEEEERFRGGRRDDGNSNSNFSAPPRAYYVNPSYSAPPHAYYANPYSVTDPTWYMDSGANYHVTPHFEQLEEIAPTSKSHLITCTREQTPILGVGSTVIPCAHASKLRLNDVLYVPSATKSLMSVNKLVRDNPVHINFTNQSCDVKDSLTGDQSSTTGNSKGGHVSNANEGKKA